MKLNKSQEFYLNGVNAGVTLYEKLIAHNANITCIKVYDIINYSTTLNHAISKGITGIHLEPYKTELEWAIARCLIAGLSYRIEILDDGFAPEKCYIYLQQEYCEECFYFA